MFGGEKKCTCRNGKVPICPGGLILELQWQAELGVDRGCECPDDGDCIRAVYQDLLLKDLTTATLGEVAFPKPLTTKENLQCLMMQAKGSLGEMPSDEARERIMWSDEGGGQLLKDVELAANSPILVVGNIHGRLGTLNEVFQMWFTEMRHAPYVVALGGWVGRGNRQLEVAAAMIAWRALYPNKVSLVKGYHELDVFNKQFGFKCVDGTDGESRPTSCPYPNSMFFKTFNQLFDLMPAAVRIMQPDPSMNAVFMHGGFGSKTFQYLEKGTLSLAAPVVLTRKRGAKVLEELLWSESKYFCNEDKNLDCEDLFAEDMVRIYPSNKEFNGKQLGDWFNDWALEEFLGMMGACFMMTGHSDFSGRPWASRRPSNGTCSSMAHFITRTGHKYWNPSDPATLSAGLVTLIDAPFPVQIPMYQMGQHLHMVELDFGVDEGYPATPRCAFFNAGEY